jgi:hypothetical protein
MDKTAHDLEWIYHSREDGEWNAQALANTDPENRIWFSIEARDGLFLVIPEAKVAAKTGLTSNGACYSRQKGLTVEVYKNADGSARRAVGVSSNKLTLVSWLGGNKWGGYYLPLSAHAGVFEVEPAAPAIVIVKRDINGEYLHAIPFEFYQPGMKPQRMMGGRFVWTSDGRFPARYPIALHDREERR